jgi:hypothetical protein
MIIDHSARHVYAGCKRKFYWIYVCNLSTGRSDAMERGSVVHEILAKYYEYNGDLEKAMSEVKFRRPERMLVNEEPKYAALEVQAKELVRGYFRQLNPDDFKIKAVELNLSWHMGGAHYYVGVVDAIAEVPDVGDFCNEYKTTQTIIEDWIRKFQLDNQSHGYVFLARKNGWTKVKGVILNLLRASKYPDYVREPIISPPWLLEEFEQELLGEMEDIERRLELTKANDYNGGPWPKNTDYCSQYNRICEFHKLCTETPSNRQQMMEEGFFPKREDRELNILKKAQEKTNEEVPGSPSSDPGFDSVP